MFIHINKLMRRELQPKSLLLPFLFKIDAAETNCLTAEFRKEWVHSPEMKHLYISYINGMRKCTLWPYIEAVILHRFLLFC